jgi:hypothetical protein
MAENVVDWVQWGLFDWLDIFYWVLYCLHTGLTAVVAVMMLPGLSIICFLTSCFFEYRPGTVGVVAGFTLILCIIPIRFLCC